MEAAIVKSDDEVFLLYVKEPILVKGERVQYFLCRPREIETQTLLSNEIKGVFPVSMVFDKNIRSADAQLSRLSTYRSNFLFGEIIKNGG